MITINATNATKKLRADISRVFAKMINKKTGRLHQGVRNKLLHFVRQEIEKNAPKWAVKKRVFNDLKSEPRDYGAAKVGAGIHTVFKGGRFVLAFYSNDSAHDAGDPLYGYNQYWAVETALRGRPEITPKKAKVLALPDPDLPKTRGSKGWAHPIFATHAKAVVVDKTWIHRAFKNALKRLVGSY